ncbi:MAG: arylsulfotransferase family protein [Pseudomonadales bacterium]
MFKKIDIPKVMFVATITAAVFAYGVAVGSYRIFPYGAIRYVATTLVETWTNFGMMTKTKPQAHLKQARYPGSGVIQAENTTSSGYILVNGFFDAGIELRLIDVKGNVVQRWPVQYSSLMGDKLEHIQPPAARPNSDWHTGFNGALVEPDGSVVFNLIGGGLVKLDQCGSVEWLLRKMAHHSIEKSSDGGYWVPGQYYVEDKPQHAGIATPYRIDTIMKVTADGHVEKEVSVLDLIYAHDLVGVVFANNRMLRIFGERDLVHLNDIEELGADLADAFPQFEAGDILLSLRESNLVMVVDRTLSFIKWYQIGPWMQQHDADWQADGTITVFDNRYDRTNDGSALGGSRVLSINPTTRDVQTLYEQTQNPRFYTPTQGDHQFLANGNILLTESESGRAVEVSSNGQIIWQYINRYSETEVVRLPDAIHYEREYFNPDAWSCDS